MSEEFKSDCSECKDLEFAKNLAEQMKHGYGRHNSNRSFSRFPSGSPLEAMPRVIGRLDEGRIRANPMDCEIGDAVLAAEILRHCNWPQLAADVSDVFLRIRPLPKLEELQEALPATVRDFLFEKVSMRMTKSA